MKPLQSLRRALILNATVLTAGLALAATLSPLHARDVKPAAAYRADAATPPPDPKTPAGGYWKAGRAPEGSPRSGAETINGVPYAYLIPNPIDGEMGNPDSFGSYQFPLIPESVKDATGWTATAIVRVVHADSLNLHSCSFRIFDGEREMMISLFNDEKRRQSGIVIRKEGMALSDKQGYAAHLIPFNVSEGYHTYQIFFDPNKETLFLYVNGQEIASVPRSELVANNQISSRIRWGKETERMSEARWNAVRFEVGNTVISKP